MYVKLSAVIKISGHESSESPGCVSTPRRLKLPLVSYVFFIFAHPLNFNQHLPVYFLQLMSLPN